MWQVDVKWNIVMTKSDVVTPTFLARAIEAVSAEIKLLKLLPDEFLSLPSLYHDPSVYTHPSDDNFQIPSDDNDFESDDETDELEEEIVEENSANDDTFSSAKVGQKPFRIFAVSASTGAGIRKLWEEIKSASFFHSAAKDGLPTHAVREHKNAGLLRRKRGKSGLSANAPRHGNQSTIKLSRTSIRKSKVI